MNKPMFCMMFPSGCPHNCKGVCQPAMEKYLVGGAATPQHPGAVKHDGEKVDLTYLVEYFPRALEAVCWVAEYGSRKYSRGGWLCVKDGLARYTKALLRHFWSDRADITYDAESGMAHAAHRAWNDLAALELALRDGLIELRRGNDLVDGKPVLGTAKKVDTLL